MECFDTNIFLLSIFLGFIFLFFFFFFFLFNDNEEACDIAVT